MALRVCPIRSAAPFFLTLSVRVLEMQAILIEMIENFEFSPPPGNIEIIRGAAGLMLPMSVIF